MDKRMRTKTHAHALARAVPLSPISSIIPPSGLLLSIYPSIHTFIFYLPPPISPSHPCFSLTHNYLPIYSLTYALTYLFTHLFALSPRSQDVRTYLILFKSVSVLRHKSRAEHLRIIDAMREVGSREHARTPGHGPVWSAKPVTALDRTVSLEQVVQAL
eukprot:6189177-Pleurochrysis_carterae.AAC.4